MSRFLVVLTLVVLLVSTASAVAQDLVPAGTWTVPTATYYTPAPVYAPAPVVVPAPTVAYYAPAPVYYYPRPAWAAAPWAWPAPYVYGGYTVRTRYFPYSVRTVVRAW